MITEVNCVLMDGDLISTGQEPVRVLMPHPTTWKEWSYGRKAKPPDPLWNLLAEMADVHAEQLFDELQRCGFPEPIAVREIPRCKMEGRSIRWIEFRPERVFGMGSRGLGLGYGFDIEFRGPVSGPICLGYGCHFGLGAFMTAAS
jgi:CRISPR-associated protein Csb2